MGVVLFIMRAKTFGLVKAKVNKNIVKIKMLLYNLIKQKQYNKYLELLERYYYIKKFISTIQKSKFKNGAYNPEERLTIEEINKTNLWPI